MKRFVLIASIATGLSLGVPSPALAGGSLAGTYAATVVAPSVLKGRWVVSFTTGGRYTIAHDGKVAVRGRYTRVGPQITLMRETGPLACSSWGAYSWTRTAKTLKFTPISDSACGGRAEVLSHRFTPIR
jgi:hypothetical protein